jgi:hypothetical protein
VGCEVCCFDLYHHQELKFNSFEDGLISQNITLIFFSLHIVTFGPHTRLPQETRVSEALRGQPLEALKLPLRPLKSEGYFFNTLRTLGT